MTTALADRDICRRPVLLRNWRYLRPREARGLRAASPRHALALDLALADPATAWRFPWPDEDVDAALVPVEAILRRELDRAYCIKAPTAFLPALRAKPHGRPPHRPTPPAPAASSPAPFCPCSAEARFRPMAVIPILEVAGRRLRAGCESTLFRCPFCRAEFTLEEAEVAELQGQLRRQPLTGWVAAWVQAVAERLPQVGAAEAA